MSCSGSEDAEDSNVKGDPSDLDDGRWLDSPSDQREAKVTATGTTYRCAGVSSLLVPVMVSPTVLEKKFIKQGPPHAIGIHVKGILVINGKC